MSLGPGARLGPYEIVAAIGAGGMGEVYRATDTALGRQVAIKVLPESVATDPDRIARFEREAKTLAALNHPNIAQIYGLERSGSTPALVMELVEGQTLADRIARGPIPLDEALPVAKQIAEALETAHEQGIIHRDLKPANIKVRSDGTVKVLDFGLAKVLEPTAAQSMDAAASPTITSPAVMTGVGVLLGTAAYMSPEQAKGRVADKRSDVWAFGVILFEMFTGRRPFEGEDMSDTLASVLKSDPDWTLLPLDIPQTLLPLIHGCLAKDRRKRVSEIAIATFILRELGDLGALHAPEVSARRSTAWRHLAVSAAALLVGSIVTGVAVWFGTRPAAPRVLRATITPAEGQMLTVSLAGRDFAVSPNATRIVYAGNSGTQLFVRAMDQLGATPLSGLGVPNGPFFSPDGDWIGFFDGPNLLKKVAVTGGPALTLCRLDGTPRGATWGDDDSIVFATANATGLWRIAAAGGDPTVLTKVNRDRGEADHLWPEFLPGGRAVLFTIATTTGGIDNSEIAVLDLKTGTQKVLVRGGSHAHYLQTGHLVYGAAGTLRAVAFNLERLEVVGAPVPVLPEVLTTQLGAAGFDVARNGTLVYAPGGAQLVARTLAWVDRQGREEPIKAPGRAYTYPRISPDGKQVALDIRDQQSDIWIWDFARATLTRVTFDPTPDRAPVWSPDGRQLFFASDRGGSANLYRQPSDNSGTVERLTQSPNNQFPTSVSPDGTRLIYWEQPRTRDVMMLTIDHRLLSRGAVVPAPSPSPAASSSGAVQPLVQTSFNELNAEVSPDGRWLAYQSDESGQDEIYVRPFTAVNSARWQVSTGGATRPSWAPDGQELFFLTPTGAMMSVRVNRGATWDAGPPAKLFEGQYFTGSAVNTNRTYDISPDGRRFLMIKPQQTSQPTNLVVVENWGEELKRLVPK